MHVASRPAQPAGDLDYHGPVRVHNLLSTRRCPPQDPSESAWRMERTSAATQAYCADKGSGSPKVIAAMNSLRLTGVLAGALFAIYPSCHAAYAPGSAPCKV